MLSSSSTPRTVPKLPIATKKSFSFYPKAYSKELHFNHDFFATKKLQAGVDLVADLLGVTLGPKGRNVVLGNKYGPPKIVNDGETVLKEVELEDPLENVGVKLVRQAAAKTNDLAGDGSTTSIVLAQGLISEGVKVLAAGMNPVQLARGIEKTAVSLVSELKIMSRQNSEEKFDKKIVNERIARLSGGIAIIEVGAQTVVELKDRKLRIEDALNAARAAIDEGVVVGGGCSLLRLSTKVDSIKESLDNEEQKIGAEIFKRALSYPAKLIAKNAGVNGSVVVEKVLSVDDVRYGYNAATNCFEDLMAAGILDPSKVVRCCVENAASVAKIFLTSDVVVVDANENLPRPYRTPMPTSNFMPSPASNFKPRSVIPF